MKYEGDDVREFTRSMERALRTLGAPHPRDREAFLKYQENQVNRLVALEEEFRRAVLLLPAWEDVYRSFVTHVRTPGDSVSARPFFRERKGTFTATIGPALLAADAATLALYRINHRFLMWFNQTRPEMTQPPFPRITTEVIQLRKEMALLLTPLTLSYIRVFWNRTPRSHLSLLDLLGHAIEGVMASVDKYTPPFSAVYRSVALGRITGNLIECYSETSVKFSSNDRRILYRANKLVGKSTPGLGGTDYGDLAARVNLSARRLAPKDRKIEGSEDLLPEYLPEDEAPFSTTAQHLSWLMGAASPVSADTPAGQDQEGAPRGTRLARIAAPAYLQPDNMVEAGESLGALYGAIGTLDLVEQKFLALRGVGGNDGNARGIGIVADQGRGEDAQELGRAAGVGQASAG